MMRKLTKTTLFTVIALALIIFIPACGDTEDVNELRVIEIEDAAATGGGNTDGGSGSGGTPPPSFVSNDG